MKNSSMRIGIALQEESTDISINGEEHQWSFPTILCRDKTTEQWHIGSDAYKKSLSGSGILVDKILYLFQKDGVHTMKKRSYSGAELLKQYLKEVLQSCFRELEPGEASGSDTMKESSPENTEKAARVMDAPESGVRRILTIEEKTEDSRGEQEETEDGTEEESVLTVCVRELNKTIYQKLYPLLQELSEELRLGAAVKLISHTEALVHYLLRQDKNLTHRAVGVFELSEQHLCYYEMQISHGSRRYVLAGAEKQDDGFQLNVLKNQSGKALADQILTSLSKRVLGKQVYSSIFLAGKGFHTLDFAPEFQRYLCTGRKVLLEEHLFSLGALSYSLLTAAHREEEYVILCDTTLPLDISMRVMEKEVEQSISLLRAGDSYLENPAAVELLLSEQEYLDFQILSLSLEQKPRTARMDLSLFPKRPGLCTRIKLEIVPLSREELEMKVTDLGFGEFYPSSGKSVTERLSLRNRR